MAKPAPKLMMDELRSVYEKYMQHRHPYLRLNRNVKLTLDQLLNFWTNELANLNQFLVQKLNSKDWGVDAPGVVGVPEYNEESRSYGIDTESELNKVQKIAEIYLRNLEGS